MKKIVAFFSIIAIVVLPSCSKKQNAQASTLASITAFSFEKLNPAVSGTITGEKISLTVTEVTDLTKLVATFALSNGATAKVGDAPQVSGTTPNDFTSPIIYTVTAQNGATQNYTVTVIVAQSSAKAITSFHFTGLGFAAIGAINETNHTIAVNVKTSTDITALKATFATTGATVKVGATPQVSGTTPNDFTSSVIYKVTAQDSSTQDYTVTVTPTDAKYVTIPDANFRVFLKSTDGAPAAFDGADPSQLNIYHTAVTTMKTMQCVNLNKPQILNLTGVEYFVSLTSLDCKYNKLTSLDLSKNTALTNIDCSENNLTSLNISKNTALTNIDCSENNLTSLNISENTVLTDIYCSDNNLTSLDLSNNTGLKNIDCSQNNLYSLDLSNNTALTSIGCHYNNLTSLDVSKNTALTSIDCSNNNLTSLDVSNNLALVGVACDRNQLTSLDLSNNIGLTGIYCSQNNLTSLDLSTNIKLKLFECQDTKFTSLDLSKNPDLRFLNCQNSNIKSLDISSQNFWVTLYVYNGGTIETIKVNVSVLTNSDVIDNLKEMKRSNTACVISTYTNSSADDVPACSNYDPNAGSCAIP